MFVDSKVMEMDYYKLRDTIQSTNKLVYSSIVAKDQNIDKTLTRIYEQMR